MKLIILIILLSMVVIGCSNVNDYTKLHNKLKECRNSLENCGQSYEYYLWSKTVSSKDMGNSTIYYFRDIPTYRYVAMGDVKWAIIKRIEDNVYDVMYELKNSLYAFEVIGNYYDAWKAIGIFTVEQN